MKELFRIGNIVFNEEEFQDKNIEEYRDIIDLIGDFQETLKIEKIDCAEKNDCCMETTENYISELTGALTEDDEFYSIDEIRNNEKEFKNKNLMGFQVQIYKCTNCSKWLLNILEEE